MHLLEASTNQLGCVGWVHPKPLPTECGSLMGFAWVSLLATHATTDDTVNRAQLHWRDTIVQAKLQQPSHKSSSMDPNP
jgi:hypothetical protein